MGASAIHPRIHSRPAVVPCCAYFLFIGLYSQNNLSCRAISLISQHRPLTSSTSIGTRLLPSHPSSFGRRPWLYHGEGRRWRGSRSNSSFRHFSTKTTSEEECIVPSPIAIDTNIPSKWEFTASKTNNSPDDEEDNSNNNNNNNFIRNILVCGDGDLSYSAEISSELDELGIDLYATVLEEEDDHNQVYKYSKSNTDIIASSGHKPMFGVDATALSTRFGSIKEHNDDAENENNDSEGILFDRIQFNFPHWRGKSNNKYNRQLLDEFLASAATVLSPRGEIHVALCDGQGGCAATTLIEWKGSWTASTYAANNGLLLAKVFPYEALYRLSSHRGVDRPFKLGKSPKMHVFTKPDGVIATPKELQLCCRHELHIEIPDDDGISAVCSLDQILAGDAIQSLIQDKIVPEGVRVEVPARQMLEIHETHGASRIAVFLVVYCSEQYPVTRALADGWREMAEREVEKYVPLRENRRGRTVSHPFPYPSLHPDIKYHIKGKK